MIGAPLDATGEGILNFAAGYARSVANQFDNAEDDELKGWVAAWMARLYGLTTNEAREYAAEAVRRFRSEEAA